MPYYKPPECDGIPTPSRHVIEPDWIASECDDQLPAFSKIGRGPRGKGVYTEIEKTDDGQVIIHFKDDETGEEIGSTGDIAAGRISVSYAPENPVAGDEVKMFVSVRSGSSVANYVVPIPSGAYGSRIYLFPGPVTRNSDDTYQCSVADLTIYGLQRWESKPEPRPNDVILFNYEDSDGHGFAFGTIEAVEKGQVVYTARVFNTLPGVSILPDGTWAVDGESTGINAQGPKGEDAKIKVRREGDKAVITATDSDGETIAEVLDGKDGQDAKLTVQRVDNGAELTAADADGVTTATVKDGSDGEDGSDGLPAKLTLGSVQETSQVSVTLVPGRIQENEYIISFGLPRGADGKSIDINGGVYRVDQLPDFDETPVNDAFVVLDNDDDRFDLYIRGKEAVIAEEGGPWTVVEDWQGVNGYSMRMLAGRKISTGEVLRIPVSEVETAFVPHKGLRDGDLVFDDNGTIGIVGSAMDDSGDYTVSYVDKMNVHWDNIDGKPALVSTDTIELTESDGTVKADLTASVKESLAKADSAIQEDDLTAAIAAEASAREKADQLLETEVDGKLGPEDIVAGKNISITHDPERGKITIDNTMKLVNSASGLVAHIDDAADAQKPLELKVYGKTRQNLWSNGSGTVTHNGITVTPNSDGSISVNGTSTSSNLINLYTSYALTPGTQYTVSVDKVFPMNGNDTSGGFFIQRAIEGQSNLTIAYLQSTGSGKASFTVPEETERCIFGIQVLEGATISGTYRVMLNEGSEAEPWCKPGLSSVGDSGSIDVVTAGKNMWQSPGSYSKNGIALTTNEDGSVTLSGTSTSSSDTVFQTGDRYIPIDATYTFSIDKASNARFIVAEKARNGWIKQNAATVAGNTFVPQESAVALDFAIIVEAGVSVSDTFHPQLELGTTATAYEPPQVTTKTITLDEPLRSLPDGTCDVLTIAEDGTASVERNVFAFDADWAVSHFSHVVVPASPKTEDSAEDTPYAIIFGIPAFSSAESSVVSQLASTWKTAEGFNDRAYRTWWDFKFRHPDCSTDEGAKAIIEERGGEFQCSIPSQVSALSSVNFPALPAPTLNVWAAAEVPCDVELEYLTEDAEVFTRFLKPSNIKAGSNVSIDVDGNDVTVSSSGGGTGGVDTATDEEFQEYMGY